MIESPKLLVESIGHVHQSQDEVKENREKNGGYIILKTCLQRAGRKNQMGRVYPKELLIREFKSYQRYVDDASATGELDHPDTAVVALERASHLIIRQWEHINDKGEWEWWGDLKLLNTDAGIKSQRLVEDGVKLGISSRGAGTVQKHPTDDADVVQNNFVMIAFDLVSHPSTHDANPMLREAFDLSHNKDAYARYVQNKIQMFVTMDLKNRISK